MIPIAMQTSPPEESGATANGYTTKWWKEVVVYQIYPRSFKDSNGDGVGDLKGIISRLDYIEGLGIDVLWLSPHYDSPNADNGYDIRDYRKIMTEFGTMADFERLLAKAHALGLKVMIDQVLSHTSIEHANGHDCRSAPPRRGCVGNTASSAAAGLVRAE